ncbi:right-handed parallel beta-helix repeat-containing protein [Streptomyces sp. MAR4 CNX-425]|uniref:right-handed parallel beta-helix repeat-containing protein n=1 Tax=Streptomyces sp. MAR4 CNX-425 TaxID=3406343 RepID=UPI003B500F56
MIRMRTPGMVSALLAPSLLLGTIGAGTAQAADQTYYVSENGSDSNAGTSPDAPLRTIQKAADRTEPGDTVSIMNGTYTEPYKGGDVLNITRSGQAGAPITYRAHPGHDPVIHPVTGWNGIGINGAAHIVIKDLEIKGNSANLNLADAERLADPKDPTYNTNCIWAQPDSSGAEPHHIDVVGNTVHHCPGLGIGARDVDHMTIDRNHVHSTSWYTVYATSGISILEALDSGGAGGDTYKIRITNNVVHDNETMVKWEACNCYSDGNGIIVDTLKDKPGGGPAYQGRVLVANNLSFDNGGSGIHSFKSQHVDIVHNTAYHNSRSSRMESYANIFAAKSEDVRILNNVSYARSGENTNPAHENVDVTYDYNVYFGGKEPEVQGENDVIADPKLVDPGTGPDADFRLQEGSPAIGTGTSFPAVTTDITGAPRDPEAPDRGAYVYGAESGAPAAGKESAAESGGNPGAGDGSGTESGKQPQGHSRPLAATGTDLTFLGVGAAVLAVGAGFVFTAVRRKSHLTKSAG